VGVYRIIKVHIHELGYTGKRGLRPGNEATFFHTIAIHIHIISNKT